MNRPIRRVAVAFMVLFFALMANVNYIQVFQAKELNEGRNNQRVLLDEYARERGAILAGGKPVAYSVKTDDRLQYLRKYDKPQQYGLLTGHYSEVFGRNLLEQTENGVLTGTDDRFFVRRVIDLVTDRAPKGGSVSLTINPKAQQAAYDGLRGKKGAVVALDPSTGAVLTMVSLPAYDPNKLASHSSSEQTEAWKQYLDDPGKPMNQRATQFRYPPGSTFKLVTTAAALESGRYEPDSKVPAPAKFDLPLSERMLNNWQRGLCMPGKDEITLTEALESSCNTAYADLGLKLGANALKQQSERFGFGTKFLPDLGGASSLFPANPNEPQTALSSIGQFDVQATPLQMAMVTAAIANGGEVMEPYLIEKVSQPDTSPLEVTEPKVVSRAVSPEVAEKLNQMMVSVVDNGTGDPAQINGIKVGGKTGTAQTTTDRPPYAWFVSFAPADNPRVAVAVVIEEADVGRSEISGGKLAAPIAKAVMEAVVRP